MNKLDSIKVEAISDDEATRIEGGVVRFVVTYILGQAVTAVLGSMSGAEMGDFTNLSDLNAP